MWALLTGKAVDSYERAAEFARSQGKMEKAIRLYTTCHDIAAELIEIHGDEVIAEIKIVTWHRICAELYQDIGDTVEVI